MCVEKYVLDVVLCFLEVDWLSNVFMNVNFFDCLLEKIEGIEVIV